MTQWEQALYELINLPRPDFRPVELLVVGCSTSEIGGGVIGHASAPDVGRSIAETALRVAEELGVDLAFQCCEHLNRALVVERAVMRKYGLEQVTVVPWPKAGGSTASAAYRLMRDPVVVESVRADAALDVGQTLVGMHLKRVAVPVRLSVTKIGGAVLTAARTRPPLIGGARAKYRLEEENAAEIRQRGSDIQP